MNSETPAPQTSQQPDLLSLSVSQFPAHTTERSVLGPNGGWSRDSPESAVIKGFESDVT